MVSREGFAVLTAEEWRSAKENRPIHNIDVYRTGFWRTNKRDPLHTWSSSSCPLWPYLIFFPPLPRSIIEIANKSIIDLFTELSKFRKKLEVWLSTWVVRWKEAIQALSTSTFIDCFFGRPWLLNTLLFRRLPQKSHFQMTNPNTVEPNVSQS